jgi:hypothetical protein
LNEQDKIQEILEYGVIVGFANGIPEFFLAKSSLQKIKQQNKNDKELEQILRDKRHFLIRKFLNDLIENDENRQGQQHQEVSKNEREDFKREIENCCSENLLSLSLKIFH